MQGKRIYEFCSSSKVSIVLGNFPGDFKEAINKIDSKIKGLISTGNIILKDGNGSFFLKRSEYDSNENRFVVKPECAKIEIKTIDSEISIEIKDEWIQVS